jgi:hypothetical protein
MYTNGVTGVTLPHAYSFDVTKLFDTTNPIAGHAYPYNIYLKSAGSATAPAQHLSQLAAHLAREFDNTSSAVMLASTYPKGTRCVISDANLTTLGRASAAGECDAAYWQSPGIRSLSPSMYQSIFFTLRRSPNAKSGRVSRK